MSIHPRVVYSFFSLDGVLGGLVADIVAGTARPGVPQRALALAVHKYGADDELRDGGPEKDEGGDETDGVDDAGAGRTRVRDQGDEEHEAPEEGLEDGKDEQDDGVQRALAIEDNLDEVEDEGRADEDDDENGVDAVVVLACMHFHSGLGLEVGNDGKGGSRRNAERDRLQTYIMRPLAHEATRTME